MANRTWALPYAPHISFGGRALFQDLVGSTDPVDLITFLAEQGFAGFQDPMAAFRPEDEQVRVGAAARDLGLKVGCFVLRDPGGRRFLRWGNLDAQGLADAAAALDGALETAARIGSSHIAVLAEADPDIARPAQLEAMARNLRAVADRAAARGVTIVLESTDAARLPGMLMEHLGEAASVVRMANHPAIRMVFDTAHIQAMDGDVVANLDPVLDLVELVQLADCPGRGEPGSGAIDFEAFLAQLHRSAFKGLVELEYLWRNPGRETETQGLAQLAALDARAAASARGA